MSEPAEPREAATVILLRDGPPGLEAYLLQRHSRSGFLGGVHAFPGGKVEDVDRGADDVRAAAARRETREEVGVDLPAGALVFWARWITPELEPRRFDAAFFLARTPAGQDPAPADRESVTGGWYTPAAAVDAMRRREILLAPPTLRALELLAPAPDVEAALRFAAQAGGPVVRPVMRLVRGRLEILLPGDPDHGEAEAVIPGPCRMVLVDGVWEYR